MKICPFCGELIQDEAMKCRYCRKWIVERIKEESKADFREVYTSGNEIEAKSITEEAKFKESEQKTEVKGKKLSPLIIISIFFIVVSIGISLYASAEFYPVAETLGGLIGRSLWIALLSYLLWRFIFRKKQRIGLLCFSIILLLVSSFQSIQRLNETSKYKKGFKEFSSVIKEMASGEEIKKRDFDNETYGELSPLLEFLYNIGQQSQDYYNRMFQEIEENGIETMLALETMKNPLLIKQAKTRLKEIFIIIDTYEIIIKGHFDEAFEKARGLDMPSALKNEFLAGFNSKKDTALKNITEFFKIERLIMSEIDNLLSFLQRKQGMYWFEGDQIYFASQEDADNYNKYMEQIEKLSIEEEELLLKSQSESLRVAKELEEKFK